MAGAGLATALGTDNNVWAGTQSWATYPPKLFAFIKET
jgi:hypothetical protein